MKGILLVVLSWIRINILDEDCLGLRLETIARNTAKVLVAVYVAGERAAYLAKKFEEKISPTLPTFEVGDFKKA